MGSLVKEAVGLHESSEVSVVRKTQGQGELSWQEGTEVAMAVKRVTPKNLPKIMANIVEFVEKDKRDGREFCYLFEKFLDDLLSQDFFGTEGQLDPRGDHRD